MNNCAIIEDGKVVNIIIVDLDKSSPEDFGAVLAEDWVRIGDSYDGTSFISQIEEEEPVNVERLAMLRRSQRDEALQESDWTQLSDSSADSVAWAAYRQALRDLPEQEGFPENIVWPEKPS